MSGAVVLQASGPNALGIVRSLARAGITVTATDRDPGALGLVSRHSRPALLPDPLDDAEGFVDGLLALGRALGDRPVLFPTHDEAIAAIGPREAEVDELFRRPWSAWPTMRAIMDKGHQHAAAERIGFPVPRTVTPEDAGDVAAAARELRFPVILKPREAPGFRRRFRAQVLRAADADELRREYERCQEFRPQISEVIPGDDGRLWTLGSYRDAEGRPLASFTGRKLRQWPPEFGTARAAEARWDPDLAARCHALLDELGFHGISQVEVKRDPRDGRDHLIEVNPRSWLWIGLATACGVNIPDACYRDATGEPHRWPDGHEGDRRWILAAKHLVGSVREIRGGRWTTGAFLASLKPPLSDGVLDAGDPRPALGQVRRLRGRG